MKFYKVLPVVGALMCSVTETKAGPVSALEGFNLGVRLGYEMGFTKIKRHWNLTPPATRNQKVDLGMHGVSGGVFLGYGRILSNCMYVGAEAFAIFANMKGKISNHNSAIPLRFDAPGAHLKMGPSFGGLLKVGGVFRGVMPYLKVGGAGTQFKFREGNGNFTGGHHHKSKYRAGVLYGIGIDVPMNDRVVIGGEFIQTRYENIKHHNNNVGTIVGVPRSCAKPVQNTIALTARVKLGGSGIGRL